MWFSPFVRKKKKPVIDRLERCVNVNGELLRSESCIKQDLKLAGRAAAAAAASDVQWLRRNEATPPAQICKC